jgi:lipopolysaccharide/colanic/teichoic acid biosynthesis glycosyltransferase
LIAKRCFDVCASALGLLLLTPLFLLAAAWIKVDSRGPVFFRQQRVGLHGCLFKIHKFRTMYMTPPGAGLQITVGADARITRSGAFLRRHKLDELPQLIDVLKGDMSIIGPRPEVQKYMALYPPEAREKILSVRPGITDWASIRFKDESALLSSAADPEHAYVHEVLPIKQRFYLDYVAKRSFGEDMRILAATLSALLGKR